MDRFKVTIVHGERETVYHVVDAQAPEEQQPSIVASYSTKGHSGAHSCAIYRAECENGRGYHPSCNCGNAICMATPGHCGDYRS